jgi:predicted nuclease with TOPRIM domain
MKTEKNIYRKLSQKITISLAQQMELKQKSEMLQQHNSMLESRIEHLLKELKALSDENSDLKEIVFTLNQENERLRP